MTVLTDDIKIGRKETTDTSIAGLVSSFIAAVYSIGYRGVLGETWQEIRRDRRIDG